MRTMSDSPPTFTDTSRDSLPTFSVVEVAAILGISKDAVRARLHRGTLEGRKIEGAWRIRLPDDVPLAILGREDRQGPTPHATAPTPDTTPNATPPQSDIMIEHLRHLEGEVEYLRERLEEADRQRGSLHRQLEAERERADILQLRAIGSGAPDAPQEPRGSPERDDTGLRALWDRLRRLWGE